MRGALVGSIGIHAAVLALVVAVHAPDRTRSGTGTSDAAGIELVEATATPVEVVTAPSASGAGGATGREVATPRAASGRGAQARRATAAARAHDRDGELADDGDPRGAITFEPGGTGGDATGTGHGSGSGAGAGVAIGPGTGGTIAWIESLPSPPPAPRASKARPPRLIYPARTRDAEDRELFVARVTVDDEGYVVGAKLVRGFGGRRDDMAASLIWRFRYAPALDDDGHAIRATLDQGFLVE